MASLAHVMEARRGFEEIEVVRLTEPFAFKNDVVSSGTVALPAGATGTVVTLLEPEVMYIVEFIEPVHALVDVAHGLLAHHL